MKARDRSTPLLARQALYRPGQATWPEPALKRQCVDCAHFEMGASMKDRHGTCAVVRRGNLRDRRVFSGLAPACPEIKEL